jgi:hypothetical protein
MAGEVELASGESQVRMGPLVRGRRWAVIRLPEAIAGWPEAAAFLRSAALLAVAFVLGTGVG